jgi:ribose transport system substrate-binding protein
MIRKKFALFGTVAVVALALAACSTGSGGGSGAQGAAVCFVTPAESHPYVTPFNDAVRAGAEAAGVDLTVLSSEFDVQTSAEQLNQCVSQAPAVIILWPLDPSAYIPGLIRAQEAGIPVVQVNSPMDDEASKLVATFTGPDTYSQGKTSAEAMAAALPSGGKIVVLAGQAGNGTTIGRGDGFTEALSSDFEILDTVNADFDQQTALTASRDLITRFGEEIAGVYAQDDNMAAGWADAYKEAGLTKAIALIGIGGSVQAFALIEAGNMFSTILQSPAQDGELAWVATLSILNGDKVEPRIPLENIIINQKNISEFTPAF